MLTVAFANWARYNSERNFRRQYGAGPPAAKKLSVVGLKKLFQCGCVLKATSPGRPRSSKATIKQIRVSCFWNSTTSVWGYRSIGYRSMIYYVTDLICAHKNYIFCIKSKLKLEFAIIHFYKEFMKLISCWHFFKEIESFIVSYCMYTLMELSLILLLNVYIYIKQSRYVANTL